MISLLLSLMIGTAMAQETFTPAASPHEITMDARTFQFKPLPDITAYELSKALPFLIITGNLTGFDNLPPEVRRHFVHER